MNIAPCDAIVLNWRDAESTLACAEALAAEAECRFIWLVDNETDGSLKRRVEASEALRGGRVRVIAEPRNLGFSSGINIGMKTSIESGAKRLLIINNDALIRRGALRRLLHVMGSDPRAGLVGPRIVNSANEVTSNGGRFVPWRLAVEESNPTRPDFLTWAAVLLRAETILDIGLLDERFFMYWEDVDYGLRANAAGWRLIVADEAVVEHKGGASHRQAGSRVVEYSAYGAVILAKIHRGALIKLGAMIRISKRLLGYAVTADWERLRAVYRGARTALTSDVRGAAIYPRDSG
ncbi:glycosyltransferase family 2 protein [Nocardioides sp. BP30]|uniref:glycosyltransferase family 2 protein n=1 Tax=Nocardioides sp. BP30 TaxID=3036374 RepID=UPI002469C50E|nr:glycosyltransferase family 2 protein [Nocardioides sp. BP30]WGL52054.1 glycosyltransferase family 2 protein [Nocardioides sp. BP30]